MTVRSERFTKGNFGRDDSAKYRDLALVAQDIDELTRANTVLAKRVELLESALSGNSVAVFNEVPAGDINGVNTDYTTANDYISGSLMVVRGGQYDLDITEISSVAFKINNPPLVGESIIVNYNKA